MHVRLICAIKFYLLTYLHRTNNDNNDDDDDDSSCDDDRTPLSNITTIRSTDNPS